MIVELSFKLAPLPPATATLVGQFEIARTACASASARCCTRRSRRWPWSSSGRRRPKPRDCQRGTLLVLRLGGYAQAVERQVRDLGELIVGHGGARVEVAESAWDDLARMRVAAQRQALVLKAAVPIAQSSALVELLEQELADLHPRCGRTRATASLTRAAARLRMRVS